MKLLTSQPVREGYWVRLNVPFSRSLNEYIKQFPGRQFDWDTKVWSIPVELYQTAANKFPSKLPFVSLSPKLTLGESHLRLYQHQADAVLQAMAWQSWLCAFETGTGKTHVTLELICRLPAGAKVAIITQASLVPQWVNYVESLSADVQVAINSYEQAKNLQGPFDLIVLDESQNIANPKAQRTKQVFRLRDESPNAIRLALSATPIPDDPQDIWTTLEFLYPGRFGTFYSFCERYCNKEVASSPEGEVYGTTFWGLNKSNSRELAERLSWCGSFVSKEDLGNILPKITIERIDTDDPVKTAVQLAKPETVILTWHRKMAQEIASHLGVTHIDGSTLPSKRANMVVPGKPVVATAGSMGTGTNAFLLRDDAIIAELAWSAKFFSQTIGRFARLGGPDCNLKVLVTKETDIIAVELERKLAAISGAKPLSLSEKLATAALEQTDYKSRMAQLKMEDEDA